MMANTARKLVALGLALTALTGQSIAQSPVVTLEPSIVQAEVPMRDGIALAADVYFPGPVEHMPKGGWPIILMRTPYDRTSRLKGLTERYVSHGYALVVEDTRGRYNSGGHWSLTGVDGNDGYDTAKWILAQPWSNGKIGTVGTSYEGGTQHAMAIAGAPGLSAMVPRFAVSDIGEFGVRHQGAFELRFYNWVFAMGDPGQENGSLKAARRAVSDPASAPAIVALASKTSEYVRALPLRPGTTPLRLAPDYERWLVEALSHGDNDAFWTDSGFGVSDHIAEWKDVPAYHVTGWYDSWAHQVADINYPLLARTKHSPQRLIVGPWTHSRQGVPEAGEADFTPDARIDIEQLEVRWFDHFLKGEDNGVERVAPVRIYVMGGGDGHRTAKGHIFVGGYWRDEHEWPLARTRYTPWYLHVGGTLSPSKPEPSSPISYAFDPKHPVPTLGGNVSSQGKLASAGVVDQTCSPAQPLCEDTRPLAARNDVIAFRSEPLAGDLEITGPLLVKIWAASDGPDTDFTAKLVDEWPPSTDFPAGYAMNVNDGIIRGRYRASLKHATPMVPGTIYPFEIRLYPTSLIVKAGHRLRLDIASSNFPRFDVNPNTGEALNQNRRTRVATNTIYLDPAHPSAIILPVIPAH